MAKGKRFRATPAASRSGKAFTTEQPLTREPLKPVPDRGRGKTIGKYDHFYINRYDNGLVTYELFPAGAS